MKNLEVIISGLGTIVGLTVTTITFLLKFIKSAKAKKAAEEIVKIGNAVIPYIEQAEKFLAYSGTEKKEYVMTKANQYAIENNIPFDAGLISKKIEELVNLTKEVNKDEKTATEAAAETVQTTQNMQYKY